MTEPAETVLRLAEVSKSFTGVRALHEVSLDVRAGEVLALMGENGAGKSTLLRIIGGDHQPTSGRLEHHGTQVSYNSPAATRAAGIRVIAQEPEIVPHVDVAENVFVGVLPSVRRRFSRRLAHERLREELTRSGFDGFVDPGELGRRLSPAQRQIVEILRGLVGNPSVVAFDEPTSSLSDPEVDILFALIDRLRSDGVAIIYVSHRMSEIFRIADRVAVLRDGQLVGVRDAQDTSDDELVRMMVGRDVDGMFRSGERAVGAEVLSVQGLTTDDVHDIDLTVRAGEVVALAGLVGAGRSELAKAIVGDLPIRAGVVSMEGTPLRLRSPRDGVRAGIGFAPEERKAEGLILDRSVSDNLTLASLDTMRRFRFIKRATERRITAEYIESLRIKTPSPDQLIRKLSGGNQQKVVLARWLVRRPKLLILDEPTRGVDVGAKAEIYALINGLAEQGTAILVISSELPEVIGLADRILVMRDGTIAGELPQGASEEDILSLAMHGAHAPAPSRPISGSPHDPHANTPSATASTTTSTAVKETP